MFPCNLRKLTQHAFDLSYDGKVRITAASRAQRAMDAENLPAGAGVTGGGGVRSGGCGVAGVAPRDKAQRDAAAEILPMPLKCRIPN